MDLRVFIEPQQGATYDDQLRLALVAQEAGYSGFFRSDHLLAMSGDGMPGPTETWVTLGGLARETRTIRIGTLVTSATFRHPAILAIAAAQVDQMSGGRVELGIGAGWFQGEHDAYGIPLLPAASRFDRFTEQLEVITGLWATPAGESFSYFGNHYSLREAPGLPKPVQSPLPLVIGGTGKRRTPHLAARFGAEFNVAFQPPQMVAAQFARVHAACRAVGRPADDLTYSVTLTLCCGRDDAELSRRAQAIGRGPEAMAGESVYGTPDQVVDTLGRYAEVGVQRVYLQVLDLDDCDHLELVADAVLSQLTRTS